MNRDAIARKRRRAQALEALEFEREREAALLHQVEEIVVEEEGPRLDREIFVRMTPDEVAHVRDVLESWTVDEADAGGDSFEAVGLSRDDDESVQDDELGRLQAEIEASRARQLALQHYVEALDG